MYTGVVRVGNFEREPLKIKLVTTDDGEIFRDCYFNECAAPIPGFVPVKLKEDAKATVYINADKILSVVICDDQQENMRADLIQPKGLAGKG